MIFKPPEEKILQDFRDTFGKKLGDLFFHDVKTNYKTSFDRLVEIEEKHQQEMKDLMGCKNIVKYLWGLLWKKKK